MKIRLFAASVAALSALAAVPAVAQVNGIGTANTAAAVYSSQALGTAYQQIFQTYAAQVTQLQQSQQQRDSIMAQFDTDQNGQLSEAELTAAQANTTAVQQLQTLNQAIAQAQQPITRAQVYTIEQILLQYSAAVEQVIADRGVQIILSPDTIVYAPQEISLNDEIVAALNQRVPTVSTAAPADWQPARESVAIWQEVQEIIQTLQAMRAQQQAQQGAPQQPVEGR